MKSHSSAAQASVSPGLAEKLRPGLLTQEDSMSTRLRAILSEAGYALLCALILFVMVFA